MKPYSAESRRIAEREDRRYRDTKGTAVFNGWLLMIGGVLCALIGATRDQDHGIAVRLLGAALCILVMSGAGLWSILWSRNLTRLQWAITHKYRMDNDAIDDFVQHLEPGCRMYDDDIDRYPYRLGPEPRRPGDETGEGPTNPKSESCHV